MVPYPTGLPLPQKTTVTPARGCAHAVRRRGRAGGARQRSCRRCERRSWRAPTRGATARRTSSIRADWLSTLGDTTLVLLRHRRRGRDLHGDRPPPTPAYLTSPDRSQRADRRRALPRRSWRRDSSRYRRCTCRRRRRATQPRACSGLYEAMAGVDDRREPLPTAFAPATPTRQRPLAGFRGPRRSCSGRPPPSSPRCGLGSWTAATTCTTPGTRTSTSSRVRPVLPMSPATALTSTRTFSRSGPSSCRWTSDNFDLPGPSGWIYLVLPSSYAGLRRRPDPR